MGKKKRQEDKPWCWYCDREFDDEKVLIDHQRIKHFKCLECNKKLNTAGGMVVHMQQVHKQTCTTVAGAIPGRDTVDIEIFGMEGIPEADLQAHIEKLSGGGGSGKRKKVDIGALTPDQIQRQMAEFKKQQQQMASAPPPQMGMHGMQPPQAPYGMPMQYPSQGYPPQGYPPQPYGAPPQYGGRPFMPPQGGYPLYPPYQQGMPPQGYPPQGMPPQGMPPQGMPPHGMPPHGMPPQGMPPQGMPPQGMPSGMPPPGMPPYGVPPPQFGPGPGPNQQWPPRPPMPFLPPRPTPPPQMGGTPPPSRSPSQYEPAPFDGYSQPAPQMSAPMSTPSAPESAGYSNGAAADVCAAAAVPAAPAKKTGQLVYSDNEISVEEKRALHPKYAYQESASA
ncbi:hypothetical protein PhCBS80983_g05610 [Powellomyces hirtus]|uniref:BED-type domain-containing protein n=1 Tax=Powellomyces hirtus TaxID=109895 RepID=A0A507DW50_9FUNG|nr:hypothetical protein PhCBS80983_g05610 [Powellomyces hirtus]